MPSGAKYDSPMLTLALDTATTAVVVGLLAEDEVRAERVLAGDAHPAQQVLVAVADVLEEAGWGPADLTRIAVGVGPGSFTGLRVGLATAIGLGDGAGIAVAPANTLRTLQRGAGEEAVAVVDARRGEVFAAGPGVVEGAYTPDGLAALVVPGTMLIGDGAVRHRAALAGCRIPDDDDPRHRPSAAGIAAAAVDGAPVEPHYLREPDAVAGGVGR